MVPAGLITYETYKDTMSWYWKVIPTEILSVGYLVVGKQYIPITVTYIIWQFYSFQALRHEEFKEGCDAACNG